MMQVLTSRGKGWVLGGLVVAGSLAGCKSGVTVDPVPVIARQEVIVDSSTGWQTVGSVPVEVGPLTSAGQAAGFGVSREGDSLTVLFTEGRDAVYFGPVFYTGRFAVAGLYQKTGRKVPAGFDPGRVAVTASRDRLTMLAPGTGAPFLGWKELNAPAFKNAYALVSAQAGFSGSFEYGSQFGFGEVLARPLSGRTACLTASAAYLSGGPAAARNAYLFGYAQEGGQRVDLREYSEARQARYVADVGGAELDGRFYGVVLGYNGQLRVVDPFVATDSADRAPVTLAFRDRPEFTGLGAQIAVKAVPNGLVILLKTLNVAKEMHSIGAYYWARGSSSINQFYEVRGITNPAAFTEIDLHSPEAFDFDAEGRIYQVEAYSSTGQAGSGVAVRYARGVRSEIGSVMLTGGRSSTHTVNRDHVRLLDGYLYTTVSPLGALERLQQVDVVRVGVE